MNFFMRGGAGLPTVSAPTLQTYGLANGERTTTTIDLAWSRGNGSYVLVVARSGSAVNADPSDLSSYSASSVFGSGSEIGTGNFVVYKGTGTSITITGLTAGITYHFEAFEFNGNGGNEKYLTVNEKGRHWVTQSAPPTGMIGACRSADGSILVRSGEENVYYSTNGGETWTLWFTQAGAAFHSCECCEGGTIHNAAGTPVARKFLFNDHSGSGKIYAGYVPGDTPETVITAPNGQKWNEGAWNSSTSNYCAVADEGSNRIVILANARTASYQNSLDTDQIASVCSTPGASDGTEFITASKNAGVPGQSVAKRVSGSWTRKSSPLGRDWHMIQFASDLGTNGRVGVSSADDTGQDFMWSDDFFETYNLVALDGAYGAWYWDSVYNQACAVSRTPNQPIAISTDLSTWISITNPVADAIWFNVLPYDNIWTIQASSGSSLGAKTTPGNLENSETRYNDYLNYTNKLTALGYSLPADNTIRDFFYGLQDFGLRSKFQAGWFADKQTVKGATRVNLKDPDNFLLTEVGTVGFSGALGVRSESSSYWRTGWIPATDNTDVNSLSFLHRINDDVEATVFDYGCQDATGATERISINTHAVDDTIASVAMNSSSVASNANASSVGRYANVRTGAAAHTLYKNGAVFDSSLANSTGQPSVESYWCAWNNNGTASLFSARYQGYLLIFKGLTAQEVANLDTLLDY